jgi:hypothetical protein
VHPVKIDVFRLKTAQGLFALRENRLAPCPATVWVSRVKIAAELGSEYQPLATRLIFGNEITDDFFRVALGIQIGCIDEVSAAFQKSAQDVL